MFWETPTAPTFSFKLSEKIPWVMSSESPWTWEWLHPIFSHSLSVRVCACIFDHFSCGGNLNSDLQEPWGFNSVQLRETKVNTQKHCKYTFINHPPFVGAWACVNSTTCSSSSLMMALITELLMVLCDKKLNMWNDQNVYKVLKINSVGLVRSIQWRNEICEDIF